MDDPKLTPGDYIDAGVDPPHYDDDPFLLQTEASRAKHEAAYQAALKHKLAKLAEDDSNA